MQKWLENNLVPLAAKFGSNRYLMAISHGFIAILPVTMAGSFATLLNALFRDMPNGLAGDNPDSFWLKVPGWFKWLIAIDGNVWYGTIAIISLVFVFSLGYNIAKSFDVPALAGGVIVTSSFLVAMPQDWSGSAPTAGGLQLSALGSTGLFTALLVGLIGGTMYSKLMKTKLTIKMPDGVPPAVSQSFSALVPGIFTIFFWATLAYVVFVISDGNSINGLISTGIQKPLLGLSQGFGAVIIAIILVQFFWFFGLHGTNLLSPVLDSIYLPALLDNQSAFNQGVAVADLPYMWTRGSFDAFVWMGGAGGTIILVASILWFSKRQDQRMVAKLGLAPGIFNINEPVIFGLPIVLNPIFVIPFILAPLVMTLIAYAATAASIVPPVYIQVPWITPPIINAFVATGGSFTAALLAIVNIVVGFIIWSPFVIASNKVKNIEE